MAATLVKNARMRFPTVEGCSSGAMCVPPRIMSSSALGICDAIHSESDPGVKVSRSPAMINTGTLIFDKYVSAL